MHKLHRLVVSYIIESVRSVTGCRIRVDAGPVLVRPGDPVDDPYDPFNNVIDISEVSLHLPVVKDVYRVASEYGLCENEIGHVRPSPGAVYRKEPETRAGETVKVCIGMGHQLVRLLGRIIKRHRVINIMVHGI